MFSGPVFGKHCIRKTSGQKAYKGKKILKKGLTKVKNEVQRGIRTLIEVNKASKIYFASQF